MEVAGSGGCVRLDVSGWRSRTRALVRSKPRRQAVQCGVQGETAILDEGVGQLEEIAPTWPGEPALDEPYDEDDGKLEPLGLVDGEYPNRRRIDVDFRHRGVVAHLDQGIEVAHHLAHPIV